MCGSLNWTRPWDLGWVLPGSSLGTWILFWGKVGCELVLTFHVSGCRLESGMQNLSIHTKSTSGYAGQFCGPWGWRAGGLGGLSSG